MPRPRPLLDFVPALSPKWERPRHMAPLAAAFERAEREPVLVFATAPPRHGKTELLKHGIVWRLLAQPTCRIAYGSYSSRYAEKRSREIRKLYERARGHVARDANRVADWRTGVGDGGLWATGVGGSWTGEGFDLLVIDDPIKGRAQAESAREQEKLWDWFNDDAETRLEPGGSILVMHTRWTTQDLGGRLLARGDYEHIHLPAINARGEALWPGRFPVEVLRSVERKRGPYAWASLYQGSPFVKGGRVFHDVQFWGGADDEVRELPEDLRVTIGIDLAYSKKSHADYSTAVVLGFDDDTGDELPRSFVLDVVRVQEEAPAFIARVQKLQHQWDGADLTWYYAGTEKGLIDVMQALGLEIDARPATTDKHTRAQPVAAAWNAKRILLPRAGADWLDDLATELASFTGVDDLHDDQVDALAAAWDAGQEPGWQSAMKKIAKVRDQRDRKLEEQEASAPGKMWLCSACKIFHFGACPKAA